MFCTYVTVIVYSRPDIVSFYTVVCIYVLELGEESGQAVKDT